MKTQRWGTARMQHLLACWLTLQRCTYTKLCMADRHVLIDAWLAEKSNDLLLSQSVILSKKGEHPFLVKVDTSLFGSCVNVVVVLWIMDVEKKKVKEKGKRCVHNYVHMNDFVSNICLMFLSLMSFLPLSVSNDKYSLQTHLLVSVSWKTVTSSLCFEIPYYLYCVFSVSVVKFKFYISWECCKS